MTAILISIFIVFAILILHSYLFYPWILNAIAKGKNDPDTCYSPSDDLPQVYVVFAAYNEESVIREKLESVMNTDYPLDKIKVFVGSDGSSDATDEIVTELSQKYAQVTLYQYNERSGKAMVVNRLMEDIGAKNPLTENEAIIFTDANIMFEPHSIFEMVKHFKDPKMGQVGGNVLNKGVQKDGISQQEQFYISRENDIKYKEGKNWGAMMGAFGACYALRANLFVTIPRNFLMEDFYISMYVLQSGYKAILELKATCWEDLPNEIDEEFKRKIRISAGNFQNLGVYYKMLWPPFSGKAFAFISHKVIRWLTPFLLIMMIIISGILAVKNSLFLILFIIQVVLILTPLIDHIIKKINIHSLILRFVSYFYAMNIALLVGFFKYVKGVKTNVWQPTKRNTPEA